MKRKLFIVGLVAILGMYLLSMSAIKPSNLGVSNGRLTDLPDSPNAVSSQTEDEERQVAPIPLSRPADQALDAIVGIIEELPRTEIVVREENYLHIEFTSLVFRFVDDVEFLIDDESKLIHFRSASRIGHSDLGANRRRMEDLRTRITSALQNTK